MSQQGQFLRQSVRQADGKDDGGSFTDPVFDDEYYGRDKEGGKGRTIGLIIGVVVGAIIAGAAAWTVFGPGAGQETARTPLIVAKPEPYKSRPDDPGGMQVENQDKLVYERVGGATAPPGAENILPPPEEPRAPEIAPEIAAEPAPEVVVESAPAPAAPVSVPSPAAEAPISEPSTIPNEPEAAPEIAQPVTPAVETPQAPQVVAAPESPTRPAALAAPTSAGSIDPLSGDHLIQIAALRTEEAAQGEWQRLSNRYSSLLGSYRPVIVRADLGERGIFFRLRAGPLNGRTAADSLCESLKAENIGCLVVRNE